MTTKKKLYIVVASYEGLEKPSIYGPDTLEKMQVIEEQLTKNTLYTDVKIAALVFIGELD